MRDAKRLDAFYEELTAIHKRSFCDWRFGQLIHNIMVWLSLDKGVDVFFPEEDKMIEYIREFEKYYGSVKEGD